MASTVNKPLQDFEAKQLHVLIYLDSFQVPGKPEARLKKICDDFSLAMLGCPYLWGDHDFIHLSENPCLNPGGKLWIIFDYNIGEPSTFLDSIPVVSYRIGYQNEKIDRKSTRLNSS